MTDTPEFDRCCGIIMPFGKYRGEYLVEIPLRYLDETIAVMPPTWLVRQVIRLIDEVIRWHPDHNAPGAETASQILEACWHRSRELTTQEKEEREMPCIPLDWDLMEKEQEKWARNFEDGNLLDRINVTENEIGLMKFGFRSGWFHRSGRDIFDFLKEEYQERENSEGNGGGSAGHASA